MSKLILPIIIEGTTEYKLSNHMVTTYFTKARDNHWHVTNIETIVPGWLGTLLHAEGRDMSFLPSHYGCLDAGKLAPQHVHSLPRVQAPFPRLF